MSKREFIIVNRNTFESAVNLQMRNRAFEDRWDTLDYGDDFEAVVAPSDSEVDQAVRKLDLVDDVCEKGDTVVVDDDGAIRVLDFDDVGSPSSGSSFDDDKVRELDIDPVRGRGRQKKTKVRQNPFSPFGKLDLDFDDDEQALKNSRVIATIDDVKDAMTSEDPVVVQNMIKRYAPELEQESDPTFVDIILVHAQKGNVDSLKSMLGDKALRKNKGDKNYDIDMPAAKRLVDRLRNIAVNLKDEDGDDALLPNAIFGAENDDKRFIDTISYLLSLDLPVDPTYVRGAIKKKCYKIAKVLLDKVESIDTLRYFIGDKGLIERCQGYTDIPDSLLYGLIKKVPKSKLEVVSSSRIEPLVEFCRKNKATRAVNYLVNGKEDDWEDKSLSGAKQLSMF